MTDDHPQPDARIPSVPEEYRPLDIEFLKDPHENMRAMRQESPLHRSMSSFFPGIETYAATRYADVHAFLASRDTILDTRKLPDDDPRNIGGDGERILLTMDPPEQDRQRSLVNKAFTPRAIDALKPRIDEIANALLDEVDGHSEIDFMAALATPLPVIVIAELIGVPPEDRDRFKEWSHAMVAIFSSDAGNAEPAELIGASQQAQQAVEALREYFANQIALRRAEPRDDLLSRLLAVEEDGEQLREGEIIAICGLLLVAGNLTTTDLLGNGLLELLRHPEQMQILRDDISLLPSAIEEMLRYTPPVTNTADRVTAREMEIGGCPVGMHRSVSPSLLAANRDPAIFESPDRFDVTRAENPHLSFGRGVHFCLGAPLARAEAFGALSSLLERYPQIEAAIPLDEVQWRGGGGFRGLRSLPLRVR